MVVGDRLFVLTSGYDQNRHRSALLAYDLSDNRWERWPAPKGRAWFNLVPAGDMLLAISGSDESGAVLDQVFDPGTRRWRALPDDPLGPSFDRFAVWTGDRLVLSAKELSEEPGSDGPSLVQLAYLDRDLRTWRHGPATETIGWIPVWAKERVVWPDVGSADGGETNGWGRSYPYGAILDPATGTWSAVPVDGEQVGDHPLDGLVVGLGVIIGADLVDPVTRAVTELPDPPAPTRTGATILSGDRFLFVWGGGHDPATGPPENLDTGVQLRTG